MKTISTLPVGLPDDRGAKLPQTYENAQRALAECTRVDEAWNWQNKAQALGAYARMARDKSLEDLALRIRSRAIRRAGELLSQIPRADEATRFGRAASDPPVTRTQVAEQAGLSERQRKTALRIAEVPQDEFESALASPRPPTVTEMAARGTVSRPQVYVPDDVRPAPVEQAMKAQTRLREFAAFCGTTEPAAVARACATLDIDAIQGYVETIDQWLNRFAPNLSPLNAEES